MAEGRQRIQSLHRGLCILEFVAAAEEPVRLAELAKLLGIEKSSAHRLAGTLVDAGYLAQDPETSGYILNDKIFRIAGKLAGKRRVVQQARKYLRQLARQTGETAHLAVPGSEEVMLLDHEFGQNPVGVTTQWGSGEPYHCTAVGKALLAEMSLTEIQSLLGTKSFKRFTSKTITRPRALVEQCWQVVRDGFAFDLGEFREGMNCVASPIYDFRGHIIAAIGVSGPRERFSGEVLQKSAQNVKRSAEALSAEMGYLPS